MSLRVEVFDDDRWAAKVGERWAELMGRQPDARLCLPTGATPAPVYAYVAQQVDFRRATVFLLDEFTLPPDDPARCSAMLERDFLNIAQMPPRIVHTLDPEAPDPIHECRRFEALVDSDGIDLTILGLGANGHLGLNEPGTPPEATTRVVRLASSTIAGAERYGASVKPTSGMTLGLRAILASAEIWLLVTGPHKAGILDRARNGPISPDVPATLLRDHPNTTVFADRPAAG